MRVFPNKNFFLAFITGCIVFSFSFFINQNKFKRLCLHRYQHLNFNALESDPLFSEQLKEEILNVKSMSSFHIKLELKDKNVSSLSIFDRFELEKTLATVRLICKMKQKEHHERDTKSRQLVAERILSQSNLIKKMTVAEIMSELNLFNRDTPIQFTSEAELVTLLSLYRLGILPQNVTNIPYSSNDDLPFNLYNLTTISALKFVNISGLVIDDISTSIKKVIENVIPEITPVTLSSSSSSSSQGIKQNIENIAMQIIHTKSEISADKYLKSISGDDVPYRYNSNRNIERNKPNHIISEKFPTKKEILGTLSEACTFDSFDDLLVWANEKSRKTLLSLLSECGVKVPKVISRSSLSTILADTIMVRKAYNNATELTNVISRPAFNINSLQQYGLEKNTKSVKFSKKNEHISKIFSTVSFNISDFVESISQRFKIRNQNLSKIFVTGIQSAAFKSITLFISSLMKVIYEFSFSISNWACADGLYFDSKYLLFFNSFLCILTRKGIFSFLISFLIVRLVIVALKPFPDEKKKINNI